MPSQKPHPKFRIIKRYYPVVSDQTSLLSTKPVSPFVLFCCTDRTLTFAYVLVLCRCSISATSWATCASTR